MQFSRFYASGLSATGQNKHWPLGGWGAAPRLPLLETLREYAWDPGSASKPKSAETAKMSPDLNPHCLNTTAAARRPFKP